MSSRIKGLPPRVQIRQWDDQAGSYPNSKRQDIFESFEQKVFFDDTKTINFGRYQNIHFPNALISGSAFDDNLGSTIISPGNQVSGISDTRINQTLQTQGFKPYIESNLILDDSNFAMTGTSLPGLPGWNERIGSKFSVNIDISANESKKIYRWSPDDLDTPTIAQLGKSSGFCYFNFEKRRWEDIGLTDPLTGQSLGYTTVLSASYYTEQSKTIGLARDITYVSQFSHPTVRYTLLVGNDGDRITDKYVGLPTDAFGAPRANKYFASASQVIKLENNLGFPFVLEKIRINIPVSVTKTYREQAYPTPSGYLSFSENYVFFLYKQMVKGNTLQQQVSGSQRFLIASASVCYYNPTSAVMPFYDDALNYPPDTLSLDVTKNLPRGLPTHSPAVTIIINTGSENANPPYGVFTTTRDLTIDMVPAVSPKSFPGATPFRSKILGSSSYNEFECVVQNGWQGGTTSGDGATTGSYVVDSILGTTSMAITPKRYLLQGSTSSFGNYAPNIPSRANYLRTTDSENDPFLILNANASGDISKPIAALAYDSSDSSSRFIATDEVASKVSPYIFFPGDSLVLGVDAGISPVIEFYNGNPTILGDNDPKSITGSFIEIRSGSASITLFGSILRENKPIAYTPNQVLTSNAIHEALHSDNPVVDQFDISQTSAYSGSYIAEYYTGGGAVDKQAYYSSGSLSRFVKIISSERYWDSLTPNLREYSREAFSGSYLLNTAESGSVRIESGSILELFIEDPATAYGTGNRPFRSTAFPYEGVFGDRKPDSLDDYIEVSFKGSILPNSLSSTGAGKGDYDKIKRMAFTRGSSFNYSSAETGAKYSGFTGGISLRYGLANYLPLNSSAVFRRDRYGQLRDMLEQRPFTTFKTNRGSTDPVVAVLFVSASSENQIDPLLTRCENVSQYVTSSVPYFDGQIKNRVTFPSSSLNPTFKPSLILS